MTPLYPSMHTPEKKNTTDTGTRIRAQILYLESDPRKINGHMNKGEKPIKYTLIIRPQFRGLKCVRDYTGLNSGP